MKEEDRKKLYVHTDGTICSICFSCGGYIIMDTPQDGRLDIDFECPCCQKITKGRIEKRKHRENCHGALSTIQITEKNKKINTLQVNTHDLSRHGISFSFSSKRMGLKKSWEIRMIGIFLVEGKIYNPPQIEILGEKNGIYRGRFIFPVNECRVKKAIHRWLDSFAV